MLKENRHSVRSLVIAVLLLAYLTNLGNVVSLLTDHDAELSAADVDGVWTRACAILVMVAALMSLWVQRGEDDEEKALLYLFAGSCANFLLPFGALAFHRGTWILAAPAIACSMVGLILFVRSRQPTPTPIDPIEPSDTTWTS